MNKMILIPAALTLLTLVFGMSIVHVQHAEHTHWVQTAFAQNQTNGTLGCHPHEVINGVCKPDDVRKYKFGTMLLNMYDEYEIFSKYASLGEGASGAAASSGSDNQLIPIIVVFKDHECSLPESLGIVNKSPCFTYPERSSMGVRLPISNLYDLAALDHVTGVDLDSEPDPTEFFNQSLDDDIAPLVDDTSVVNAPDSTIHNGTEPYYTILVGIIIAATMAVSATLYVKKRNQVEA